MKLKLLRYIQSDLFVISAALLLIALLSFRLYTEFLYSEENQGPPAGITEFRINKAERRSGSRSVWHKLPEKHGIWSGDWIATGPGSGVIIEMNEGTRITLDQNTMLVISIINNRIKAEILEGSADVSAGDSGKEVLIESGSQSFTLQKGAARFTRKGKELQLKEILSLSAVIDNTAVNVAAAVERLEPSPQKIFFTENSGNVPVKFVWKDQKGGPYLLEISSLPDFSSLSYSETVTGTEFLKELGGGIYYWRVRRAGDPTGPYSRFFIREKYKADLVTPSDNAVIYLQDKGNASVYFSWKIPEPGGAALLEIAENGDFSSPLHSIVIERDSAIADLLPGEYSWKITPRSGASDLSGSAVIRKFTVSSKTLASVYNKNIKNPSLPSAPPPVSDSEPEPVKKPGPAAGLTGLASAPAPYLNAPRGLEPANRSVIDMSHAEEITFRWKTPDSGIPDFRIRYRFRLYSGESVIYETSTPDTSVVFRKLELLDQGQFRWSLQAFSEDNSIESEPAENYFEIILSEAPDMPTDFRSE